MPRIPTTSPLTSAPLPPSYIHTTHFSFIDTQNRTLLLRGVNLSGASKAPVGHLSHQLEDFWESAEAGGESFVGRPLRLEDGSADVHLARLRGWGFNLLRFPFFWEALEHEGPGKYDYEYMDYTIRVLCKCRDYGFRVYMDPHQDTWSRFSGGSGAPFWTLAACGINPAHITATQAALLHCEYPTPTAPDPASFPAMIWSTNYGRLLSQTLFTLFFAGETFAPKCIIDGVNIQVYLQSHFIEACGQLADRIAAYNDGELLDSCIIGWDSMNEPFEGLVGWADLSVNPTTQGSTLKKGTWPTPAQGMRLGMGRKQTVERWRFGGMGPAREGVVEVDPAGRKVWADAAAEEEEEGGSPDSPSSMSSASPLSGDHEPNGKKPNQELPDGTHPRWGWKRNTASWPLGTCIWALHGVWDVQTGFILRPDYFRVHPSTGDEVEFLADFWKPHWLAYAKRIRKAHKEAIIFVQPPVFAPPPEFTDEELGGRAVYAPHYYDGLTLITRHWNWFNADALGLLRGKYSTTLGAVKIGEGAIRKSLREQIGMLQGDVQGRMGGRGYPVVVGEIGTPFDMDGKKSYGFEDGKPPPSPGKGGKKKTKGEGDYSQQEKALDASLNACDAWRGVVGNSGGESGKERESDREQGVSWTVWTYVPDDHSHMWGDGWNGEDLSLWSLDDLEEVQELRELDEGNDDEEGNWGEEGEQQGVDNGRGDEGEEMDMIAQNEDGLNSRAGLLPHRHPRNNESRKLRKRQPERAMPMSVPGTLDAGVGLGLGLQSLSVRDKEGAKKEREKKKKMEKAKKMSRRVSDASIDSVTSNSRSITRSATPNSQRSSTSTSSNTSSSSSTTHTTSSTALALRQKTFSSIQQRAGYCPNPYTFLTDGARAVRAFARPWPTKVVGRAVDVRFEIAKGVMKMRVVVGAEDRPVCLDKSGMQEVATEVYIPLVHYAHQRLLDEAEREREERRRRLGQRQRQSGGMKSRDSLALECDGIPIASTSASSSSSSSTVAAASTTTSTSTTTSKPTNKTNSSSTPLLISDSTPDLVDIEVKLSSGRYEVRGQTLYWWYDVPGEGEAEREYTLEVRRRGGVLKVPKRVPLSAVKGAANAKQGQRRGGVMGWCEEICREGAGCVVM